MSTFKELGIYEGFEQHLKLRGIKIPTEVQENTIEIIKSGKDVVAEAPTGTGKTLAFLLPIFENMENESKFTQGLIITPTRELAIQIKEEAKKLSTVKKINILSAYGGKDVEGQVEKVEGKVDLIIGTPGRILDHIKRKSINVSKIKTLVIDEADEILMMGFREDVEAIIRETPTSRQTLCFSATLNSHGKKLAYKITKEPSLFVAAKREAVLKSINQFMVETTDERKCDALCHIMNENNPFMAIIFCKTKNRVDELEEILYSRGFNCQKLHGDLPQSKREKVMAAFKNTDIQYLIATDIAARGIDASGVTHIYNYDLPDNSQTYIHRIGRTGRAGAEGEAYLFVNQYERKEAAELEKDIKIKITRKLVKHDTEVKSKNSLPEKKYDKRINTNVKKFDVIKNKESRPGIRKK